VEIDNETIWQNKPGNPKLYWESQVFHLGNGHHGISCYGGVEHEIFTLGEKTFWTKGPGDNKDYNYWVEPTTEFNQIDSIKKYTSLGEFFKVDSLIDKTFKGGWHLGALSSVGSLVLDFDAHKGTITDYRRILDLKNSRVLIEYKVDGIQYNREYFCSYPDNVFAMRISSEKPNNISMSLGVNLMHKERNPKKIIDTTAGTYQIEGNIDDNNRPYRVKMQVLNQGGSLSQNDSSLIVNKSNSVVIYYAMATNYQMKPPFFNGGNPNLLTQTSIDKAISKGYEKVKKDHIDDYRALYARTSLNLENEVAERATLPTDERLKLYIYENDTRDLGLKELAFNFGKYMLISASRPGAMAAGLAGAWNSQYISPWNGTYQLDMNTTQTYMFGNALNLSECQEPFIEYTKLMSEVGKGFAKDYYNSDGWVSFVISDLWAGTGLQNYHLIHSTQWLALIIWEQYAFDKDEKYLKEIYPMLKGASEFYLDNLIEYKDTKKLVYWGTKSAEHNSTEYGNHIPNYQDIGFIHELFENTIEASKILSKDKKFSNELQTAKDQLIPYKIGKWGQFQEWVEDIDDPNCQHRHLSHLLCLQPCKQINPYKDKELVEAIKISLIHRRDNDFITLYRPDLGNSSLFPTTCKHEGYAFDNFPSQGWCRNARLSTWLRLHNGDKANKIYNDIMRESTLENMIVFESRAHYGDQPHPTTPFFLESTILNAGNVTEMVLQSQYGEIDLLPALPSSWKTGSIKGIRARGACTVDIDWKNGLLMNVQIRADKSGEYTVRYKEKIKKIKIQKNKSILLNSNLERI
jgi:alpha-L-fucosidase 2